MQYAHELRGQCGYGMGIEQGQWSAGKSAEDSFEDKLIDQVPSYTHLRVVSLPLVYCLHHAIQKLCKFPRVPSSGIPK